MYSITEIQFSLAFDAWNNKANKGIIAHYISVLFLNGSIWFCPFTLEPSGTDPNGTVSSADPKVYGYRFKMETVPRVLV